MEYTPLGNSKLVVPASYAQRVMARAIDVPKSAGERLHDEYIGAVEKAFGGVGRSGRKSPRQIMPWSYAQGLYSGVRDPGHATTKTQQLLRRMACTTIIRDIIETLIFNALRYMHIAKGRTDTGFEIVLAETDAKPTAADKKAMKQIAEDIETGGHESERAIDGERAAWSREQTVKGDPLTSLAPKFLRDSLTLDWAAMEYETGTNRYRYPMTWWHTLDAAQIRTTEPDVWQGAEDQWGNKQTDIAYKPTLRPGIPVEYVQRDETDRILREFAYGEVAVLVRNERSDMMAMGYGWPELASLVDTVVGMITAVQHNVDFFTSNRVPPGIGIASGEVDEDWLQQFLWDISHSGVEGGQMYKLPILFGDKDFKFTYTPFRNTEKMDMYWSQWLQFLIAEACAAFRVASEEINFQAFLTKGSNLGGDQPVQKANMMKSPGFISLMQQFLDFLDRRFVSRWGADKSSGRGPFRIVWLNLQPKDEEQQRRMDIADLNAGVYSVNQILTRRDEDEIRDPRDRDKYLAILASVEEKRPWLKIRPRELAELVGAIYEAKGGKWALWPDAPVNATLNMNWQAEHAEDLQPPQQGIVPGQEGQFGQPGEEPPPGAQQGQRGAPQGEGGEEYQGGAQRPEDADAGFDLHGREEQPLGKSLGVPKGYRVFEIVTEDVL